MELSGFIRDFENLPKHIQKQLLEYAESFISKYKKRNPDGEKTHVPSFNWENGLEELKADYSSVDLQHNINDLR